MGLGFGRENVLGSSVESSFEDLADMPPITLGFLLARFLGAFILFDFAIFSYSRNSDCQTRSCWLEKEDMSKSSEGATITRLNLFTSGAARSALDRAEPPFTYKTNKNGIVTTHDMHISRDDLILLLKAP
jgi:hypothetical protein